MEKQQIYEEIVRVAEDGRISCVRCFEIAQRCGVSPELIGEVCDDHKVKIRNCQLGCFK